jgi:hypothetical protein
MRDAGQEQANPALAARKWIGDVSSERVGHTWRAEDHEALTRTMRAADELTLALMAFARADALDGLANSESEEQNGSHTPTESVGAEAHAHSD